MKKLLTFIFILCTVALFAEMRGGSQYDPGAARANLSNVDAAATPSMTSITLSDKVKAAWADILGDIYASGTVKVSTGTAALPAYSFASDPDTGIYSSGGNQLAFSLGNSLLLRFTSDNIALNKNSLFFRDTTDGFDDGILSFAGGGGNATTRGAFLRLYGNENTAATGSLYLSSGDHASSNIVFFAGANEALRVNSAGNVLIATSTDDAFNKVQVAGAVKSFINQQGAIKNHFAQVGTSSPATSTLIVFGLSNSTEGASVLVETVGHSYNGKYTTWKAFIGCQNNSGTIAVSNASLSMTQVENIGTPITAPIITTEIDGTQVIVKATFSGPFARYSSMVNAAGYVANPR